MLVNTASLSSLYDMYKQSSMTPYNREGQMIITETMWQKFWHIQTKTFNYLKGSEGEPFWKNVTLACLDLMDHVGSYMVGEFDVHENKDLQELWHIFIKAWYFGHVWIIKDESVMEQEIKMAESDVYKNMVPEENLFRGNPFRLFERVQVNEGEKYTFRSLLTGISNFELDPKEMIYCSLNKGINFRKWWKINMEYVSGKSRVVDAVKALSKTVQVIVRNQSTYKIEREQIENPSVFYELQRQTGTIGAVEQNLYQSMPIIDGERIKDMKEVIQQMYEKECEFLGFTMNSNEKKERLTVAENYKDLRRITNIQDFQLKSLKILEEKLKEKNWVDEAFAIEISGLAFAEGLPDPVNAAGFDAGSSSAFKFGQKPKPEIEEEKDKKDE